MSETPATADFWPTIFRSFRPEDHRFLVVSTNNGLEVAVQEIARIEESLAIIRGRIAGTADAGRLFLMPYAQLSSVYVNRVVRMEEVDLYSPSVAPARKLEVARQVADIERKAREEALMAEAAKNGDVDLSDTMKRLDTLRDMSAEGEQPLALPPSTALSPSSKLKTGRLPTFGNRAARLPGPAGEQKTETKS